MPRAALALGLAWTATVALACAFSTEESRTIGVSISPVASLVRDVAGDRFEVRALLPPGRSPHDFDPTPGSLQKLGGAVLFVAVGTDVDAWMLRAARGASDAPVITLAEGASRDAEPHLWLDLDIVQGFVDRLAGALAGLDPDHAAGFRTRGEALQARLQSMDRQLRDRLASVREAPFALQHPAFTAYCRRYGLNLVAVLEAHPEGEAKPNTLGEVARTLQGSQARALFAEEQLGSRLVEALAGDLGARIGILDPLGGPGIREREDYVNLMLWNGRVLEETLR